MPDVAGRVHIIHLKQKALCFDVFLQGLVIVQVGGHQVREHGQRIIHIVAQVLVQRDAGALHHARLGPPVTHARQHFLYLHEKRRQAVNTQEPAGQAPSVTRRGAQQEKGCATEQHSLWQQGSLPLSLSEKGPILDGLLLCLIKVLEHALRL